MKDKIERAPVPDTGNDYSYVQPSATPLYMETHGGDDVGLWASGMD